MKAEFLRIALQLQGIKISMDLSSQIVETFEKINSTNGKITIEEIFLLKEKYKKEELCLDEKNERFMEFVKDSGNDRLYNLLVRFLKSNDHKKIDLNELDVKYFGRFNGVGVTSKKEFERTRTLYFNSIHCYENDN